MQKADEKFKAGLPYLEKAHELRPDDHSTLISLKQIYLRLKDDENYQKIDALIKAKSAK